MSALNGALLRTEALNPKAFAAVLRALDVTLEEAAEMAGVDLEQATRADEWPIVRALAKRLEGLA